MKLCYIAVCRTILPWEDSARYFAGKGLTPDTLRVVVDRAHAAHSRVSAHFENARDFREAPVAGVDEINHMPGFGMFADVDSRKPAEFQISDSDAELAHRKTTVVVTTLFLISTRKRGEEGTPG